MELIKHRLTSTDGVYHDLYLSESKAEQDDSDPQPVRAGRPVLLCLPAMGVPARKYQPIAEMLNAKGIACAIFEWRGIDTSSVRASRKEDFGYHHLLSQDLPVALDHIREFYPDNPIYLFGHSLGGQLGILLMCQRPDDIKGVIGIATGSPYFKGWRFPKNIGLYLASKLVRAIVSLVGHFPGRRLGFAGREARQVMIDWTRTVASGQYQIEGSEHDFEALCSQIKKRALMITLEGDWMAPTQSAKNLGAKLTRSEVNYVHLTGEDFPTARVDHFSWMKDPAPVVERIAQWLMVAP